MVSHTRGYGDNERPEDYLDAFSVFVKTNMNEIAAINIVRLHKTERPHTRRIKISPFNIGQRRIYNTTA